MARPLHLANGHSSYVYTVEASDDLGRRAVTVADQYGRRLWTKTRELVGEEIVESIVDASSQLVWTVHKPTRGYYLILRSPSLPSPTFISLRPSSSPTSPDRFTFSLRPSHAPSFASSRLSVGNAHGTAVEAGSIAGQGGGRVRSGSVKRRSVTANSPRLGGFPPDGGAGSGVEDVEDSSATSARTAEASEGSSSDGTTFIIAPAAPASARGQGIVSSVLNRFTGLFADPPHSFVCYAQASTSSHRRVDSHSSPTISIISSTSSSNLASSSSSPHVSPSLHHRFPSAASLSSLSSDAPAEERLALRYTDESSIWNPSSTRGKLEVLATSTGIGTGAGRAIGEVGSRMPEGFWVALALAYLEFKEDKEAYIAASEDVQ